MTSREDSKLQKIFIYFCGLLPILVFPIALIAPQGLDLKSQHLLKLFTDEKLAFNGFQFQIPALSIAALMAMALLLIYPPINLKEFPQLTKFAVIFMVLCGISALLHHSDPLKILSIWAYVIVPMSLMMCKGREKIQKFLGLYFLVNITIYFLFNSPTGISANKNWLAAGLLATLPFGVKSLQAIFFKVLICIPRNLRNSSSVILSFTFAVILTLTALYKLTSRAAWLALIIILSLKIYCGCSEKLKKFFIYFSIIMTLAIASFAKINYQKFTHNELRPLLWKGTAKMIESAPFLGASGPGQFENKFAQFRLPEQFLLPIAAPNSQHPHNEILRIASEAGLPACLALICFVILIVKGKNNNHAAYHCFIVLATCSMFDKLLAENATGLIFIISLGLLIPQHINQPRKLPFQKCRSIMACVILLVGIILCWRNIQSSWFYRHGFNDQSAAMYSLNNAKKKIYWQKSYESFAKAANDDPYNTKANYFAANAALLGLKSDSKAIPFLNNLMNRAPDYINLNRLITYYQEIRARKFKIP